MVIPICPEEWVPSSEITLEPNAEAAVRSNRNVVVVAGPGAGKTELLAQRACFLLQTSSCKSPKRILAISFKKDAATNLAERVEKRCGKVLAQRFDSYTFDAFAKSILDRFLNALPTDYKPTRNYEIIFPNPDYIQELLYELTLPLEWSGHTIHELSARNVLEKISRRVLPLENNNSLENWAINEIWKKLLHNRNGSQLTFSMISRLAQYLLYKNPLIVKVLQMTYSHIFLDEFQDTTYIQYDLLKSAFHTSQAIFTAVGDTKQRIMGWAGAVPNIFTIYCADFQAQRIDLSQNHRSAPMLVNIQTAISLHLDSSAIKTVSAKNWEIDEGLCEIHLFDSDVNEAEILARKINEWICRDNIDPRKIVILAKQQVNVYAGELIKELGIVGQKTRVESDIQDLLTEPLIQIILQFLRLATTDRVPEDWQKTVDLLIDLRGCRDEDKPGKSIGIEHQLADFIQILRDGLHNITMTDCSPEIMRIMLNQIVKFMGEGSLKNQFPQYKRDGWFANLLNKTSGILADDYRVSGEWPNSLDNFIGKNTIPIMTIHKSKGLEYDVVIFIGLEDDAFWSFQRQPHEDTCAFFVALSRAKQKVYFTFCNHRRTQRRSSLQGRRNIGSLYEMLTCAGVRAINHVNS